MRYSLMVLLSVVILITPAASFALGCGDVDNDGRINMLDILSLIDYLYKGGPAPDCECGGIVIDIDGNSYQTVQIGDQCWMVENLKVTHYRNGDSIPNVTDGGVWQGLSTGAYCNYNNDEGNAAIYGRLYNWYAVDDSRKIAPEGWRVPNDADWQILVDFLGGDAVAGGKMKDTGTVFWNSPNTGATNESGFTALPGGACFDGFFLHMGKYGNFWSSTEPNIYSAWMRYLYYNDSGVIRDDWPNNDGISIRCVKD